MSGKIPQSVEEVDAIPTLAKALTIIGNLVDIPPNTQLDEAKMIIKNLFNLIDPPPKRGPLVEMESFAAAVQVDKNNREHLRELFRRVRDFLAKLPQPFKDNLNLMYPNYKDNLAYYNEELEANTCTLLVAGETCSGKSSLINMLVGKDLLPIGDLRCTSAIVEIMYSKIHEVIVYPKNRTSCSVSPRKILPRPGAEAENDLEIEIKRIVTERDATTDESPYEKVVIRWPLECLECGVTIVDSPGVGDSAALPQTLAKYIAKAFGLIFVIDATSSIPKHRLAQLLLKASECREGFDPNTAIFVCNRWEAVSPEDSDRVRDSFVQRLSFIVPGFKGTQLYPISVKNSIIQLKHGVVSAEYAALIEGIRAMLPKTMAGKLRIYYRYVAALLERTNKSLKLSINIQQEKAKDTRKRYKEVEAKMVRIKHKSDALLEELKHKVHIFSENMANDLVCHLDSHKIRARMAEESDLTAVCQRKRWIKKAEIANTLIAEAVCKEVNEFERVTMSVKTMLDEIKTQFHRQFDLFQEQLNIVEGEH